MFFIGRKKPSDLTMDKALETLAATAVANVILIHQRFGSKKGVTQMGMETEDDVRQMEHNMRMALELYVEKVHMIANTSIDDLMVEWVEKIRKRGKK